MANQRENRRLLAPWRATGASSTSTRILAVGTQTASKLVIHFGLPGRYLVYSAVYSPGVDAGGGGGSSRVVKPLAITFFTS